MHSVKVYSLAKDGATKISTNFRVREFKCRDGGDPVFVGDELLEVLQDLRDVSGDEVYITSSYRTITYNARVGGAKKSKHMYGIAADIKSKVWTAKQVFDYLDSKYFDKYGVGYYKAGYVHIDTRPEKVRWYE